MSAEDTPDDSRGDERAAEEDDQPTARARLGEGADRAAAEFDQNVVDLLAWVLDTETRARIYVYLRQHPNSTSDEVAEGTDLYPSTVREALAELHDEDRVTRRKRESAGAGNNPYEYETIAPSELVRSVAEQVQSELNTVFNLDRRLRDGADAADADGAGPTPVTITVADESTDSAGSNDADAE